MATVYLLNAVANDVAAAPSTLVQNWAAGLGNWGVTTFEPPGRTNVRGGLARR